MRDTSLISEEHAKYGRTMRTTTYVPKLGMLLNGDHSNSYFGMPDAPLYFANQALAQMKTGLPDVFNMVRSAISPGIGSPIIGSLPPVLL